MTTVIGHKPVWNSAWPTEVLARACDVPLGMTLISVRPLLPDFLIAVPCSRKERWHEQVWEEYELAKKAGVMACVRYLESLTEDEMKSAGSCSPVRLLASSRIGKE